MVQLSWTISPPVREEVNGGVANDVILFEQAPANPFACGVSVITATLATQGRFLFNLANRKDCPGGLELHP
jgi:hypothetical protein